MQSLPRNEYPKDFYYHRTSAEGYRKYLSAGGLTTFDLPNSPQYAWIKKVFGNFFAIIKYERTDTEPDIDWIRKHLGVKHAFVAWIPYSIIHPIGWKRLVLTDHFEETGYTILPDMDKNTRDISENKNPEYLQTWHDRSKRARKKFLSSGATIRPVSTEEFIQAYRETKIRGPHKGGSITYFRKISKVAPESVRQWLAFDNNGKQIAGLAVLDYLGNHSVHLVAFTDRKNYHYQAGTGLIDEWFQSSLNLGVKYLSFDHLRNTGGPSDQKGYTAFKENFLSARLSFKEAYFKFF
ncbi:hypothetical protein KBB25_03240 [Candidatus Gracilibacteria bacterium]|nr:hypothetical protein [Candidatus Gracilibacteria bacterium]